MATTSASARTTGSAMRANRRRTRLLTVVGAVAATLAVWVVAVLVGVDVTVRMEAGAPVQRVGPAAVAIVTMLAGLTGWALLAALERGMPQARPVWTVFADNEGHGFAKKENRDYMNDVVALFLKEHLKETSTGAGNPSGGQK